MASRSLSTKKPGENVGSDAPAWEELSDLLNRKAFPEALEYATAWNLDASEIAEIHRKYGDNLYAKSDFDGAMQQYIQTIGYVQASYVIRKYIDTQRTPALTEYLQELHNKRLASSDLTTLLLNCYAKLKDVKRLDEFIKAANASTSEKDELPFDLETAISVCRQAGFHDHAVYLAQRHKQHDQYLAIQLENRKDWSGAISYIRTLNETEAKDNLISYGKLLLQHAPKEATDILIDICCGNLQSPPNNVQQQQQDSKMDNDTPESENSISVQIPSPRIFFPHFIDTPELFVRFLETVASKRWSRDINANVPASTLQDNVLGSNTGQSYIKESEEEGLGETEAELTHDQYDQRAIWNSLLELYLAQTDDQSAHPQNVSKNQEKAIKVIQNPTWFLFDPFQALVVCTNASFTQGILLLYERLGMYDDILRFWMDKSKSASTPELKQTYTSNLVEALQRFGPNRNHLYPMVMRYLASSPELLSKHDQDLQDILTHIENNKILSPIAVLQALSQTDAAHIGLVRGYLTRQITKEREQTETDRALVDSYRKETAKREKEIQELTNTEAPRVFQITRCSTCSQPLDLPKVYFQCKHCFHQRCLGDNTSECPICAQQYSMITEIMRSNERLADRHDLFLAEVEESEDKFGTIAQAYSKGLLSLPKVEDSV